MSRTVEAEIDLHVTARRALAAFLDPTDLRGWWGVERALVEPQVDGLYALAWGITADGFRYASTGIVDEYAPHRILRITRYTYFNPERPILGPMRLTMSIEPRGEEECRLHVAQDGYRQGADWDWYYEAVKGAWPMALNGLRKYLESSSKIPRIAM